MRIETKGSAAAPVSDRRSTPRPKVQHKSGVAFEVKAVDDAAHTFTGLAAAWTLDAGGDVIQRGAFKRTLADWKAAKKQRPIPLIDTHAYHSVNQVLGKMIDAEETADGLLATFQMIPDDPSAEAAFRRIKDGCVTGLSIGYEAVVVEYPEQEDRQKGIWRYLKEVKLREVSLVTYPMNDDARLDPDTAKNDARALLERVQGKALSDDERTQLQAVRDQIDALLAEPDSADDEEADGDSGKAGLAPEDPKRLAIEAAYRDLTLRSLATT